MQESVTCLVDTVRFPKSSWSGNDLSLLKTAVFPIPENDDTVSQPVRASAPRMLEITDLCSFVTLFRLTIAWLISRTFFYGHLYSCRDVIRSGLQMMRKDEENICPITYDSYRWVAGSSLVDHMIDDHHVSILLFHFHLLHTNTNFYWLQFWSSEDHSFTNRNVHIG